MKVSDGSGTGNECKSLFVGFSYYSGTKGIASFVPRAYFSPVTRKTLHIGCRVLLVLQITLLTADFVHTDTLYVGGSPAKIESHDCGPREIHRALDSSQPCLPCFRHTHSIAFPDAASFCVPTIRTPLMLPGLSVSHESDVTASDLKRGPPNLSAA